MMAAASAWDSSCNFRARCALEALLFLKPSGPQLVLYVLHRIAVVNLN